MLKKYFVKFSNQGQTNAIERLKNTIENVKAKRIYITPARTRTSLRDAEILLNKYIKWQKQCQEKGEK